MTKAGQRIIEGLNDAIAGNFARIYIGGQTWVRMDNDERDKLRQALTEIKRLKSTPIGDTGFSVGPAALLAAAQRIAREALRQPRRAERENTP